MIHFSLHGCFCFHAENFDNMKSYFFLLLVCSFITIGCSQNDIYEDKDYIPIDSSSIVCDTTMQKLVSNKWIHKTMRLYYYWADSIPTNMDDAMELAPEDFFRKLLNKSDRFSWINNSIDSNNEALYGKMLNKGFEYMLFYSDTTKHNLIAEVIYTYPKSYAEEQGIKRGWGFDTIDGRKMNVDNYMELLAVPESEYNFQYLNNEGTINTTSVSVKGENIALNPILKSKVISCGDHKVGYLCYRQFKADDGDSCGIYKKELLENFMDFKKKGIDNLVLDIRYNPGGDLELCVTLGSLIVPRIDSTQVALKIQYNKKLNDAYSSIGMENEVHFENNLDCYIGDKLKNIIIITGPNTASASEDLINMLLPYKKITLIGQTTVGKNYGSQSIVSTDNRIKWVIQPIIMKIFNSADKSDFESGFKPDIEIDEKVYVMKEFGDPNEPLLAAALDIINDSHDSQATRKKARMLKNKSSKQLFFNSLEKRINIDRLKKTKIIVEE